MRVGRLLIVVWFGAPFLDLCSVVSPLDRLELLPPGARPADAVIIAGAGARSTLHRDPFEVWNKCFVHVNGTAT